MTGYRFRPIERGDNASVAALIREVMPEFGAVGSGFAIEDPEVDAMFEAYPPPQAGYWVLLDAGGDLVGGAGFAPLEGGPEGVCELRKMYLLRTARGRGLGAEMLTRVLTAASEAGFTGCYLETLDTMRQARRLYERFGFERRAGPLGATGHHGCDAWYERALPWPGR